MLDRSVLPVRFGSTFADADGLRRALLDRQAWLLERLERVRGRVELGVRVAAPERAPAVVGAGSGRDYLAEKLRIGRRASGVDEPLAQIAVETRRRPSWGAGEVLRASYLVERQEVARFQAAVEALQQAHSDLAILCTGPWPPYSFVGGE